MITSDYKDLMEKQLVMCQLKGLTMKARLLRGALAADKIHREQQENADRETVINTMGFKHENEHTS